RPGRQRLCRPCHGALALRKEDGIAERRGGTSSAVRIRVRRQVGLTREVLGRTKRYGFLAAAAVLLPMAASCGPRVVVARLATPAAEAPPAVSPTSRPTRPAPAPVSATPRPAPPTSAAATPTPTATLKPAPVASAPTAAAAPRPTPTPTSLPAPATSTPVPRAATATPPPTLTASPRLRATATSLPIPSPTPA